jgi:Domain of unknown function (DUF4263)
MPRRYVSQRGQNYLPTELKRKARVVTEACLWLVKHNTHEDELSLKLGRYNLEGGKKPLVPSPKSELTLDHEELSALVEFLETNLEPFHAGAAQWLTLTGAVDQAHIEQLQKFFASPDRSKLLDLLVEHNVVADDLLLGLQLQQRSKAVGELAAMLDNDLVESEWQRFFQRNDWIMGSEFVRILEERAIDVGHIADYIMQGYDGFLDLVEIKRPGGGLKFWSDTLDHGNFVPHSDLVKAITQSARYLYEVEREADSVKFQERVGDVKTIKPRCVLIYGRSNDWDDGQREAYRILNASYHNLTILTYDHVLARAQRILDLQAGEEPRLPVTPSASTWDDIPF